MNSDPFSGRGVPALNCAFPNASPKFAPTPMTSPVDRISGPSAGSTPGNLLNGNTGDFTKYCGTGRQPEVSPLVKCDNSRSFLPSIKPTATFGSSTPVA